MAFRTRDGGKHWTVVAATGPVPRSSPAPSGLPRVGYVHTLFFSNHRDGWIGIDRGGYWSTTDGGATWKYAWSSSFRIGTDHAPSVGMLPSGFGWALEDNPSYGNTDHATTALYTTIDNGAHWREVYPLTTPTARSGLPTGAGVAPASPAPPRPSSTR